jgi:hypothetical protein
MPDKPETAEKPDKPEASEKPGKPEPSEKPKKPAKPKKPVFDPYREALVMETNTIWTEEHANLAPDEKRRIEEALHADAEKCKGLEYVRLHTGFCRQITVAAEDIQRVRGG